MRFFQQAKVLIAAMFNGISLKLRPGRHPAERYRAPSTSEAERLDRLRNPSKYLGK
jgi:hypothetical protein